MAFGSDRLDPQVDVVGSAGQLSLTLDAATSRALLTEVPAAVHGQVNDVLLAALALAAAGWSAARQTTTDEPAETALTLEMEGHGREADALGDGWVRGKQAAESHP